MQKVLLHEQAPPSRLLIIHNTAPLVFHPQQLCGDDVLLTTALDVCKHIHHMAGSRQPQQHGLFMRMLRWPVRDVEGKKCSHSRGESSLWRFSCAVTQIRQNVNPDTELVSGRRFVYLCRLQSAVWQSRLSRWSRPRVPQSFSDSRQPKPRPTWSFSSGASALKSDSTDNTPPMPAPRLSAGRTVSEFPPGRRPRLRRRSPCSRPPRSNRRRNSGEWSAKSTSRRQSPVVWPSSPHHNHIT